MSKIKFRKDPRTDSYKVFVDSSFPGEVYRINRRTWAWRRRTGQGTILANGEGLSRQDAGEKLATYYRKELAQAQADAEGRTGNGHLVGRDGNGDPVVWWDGAWRAPSETKGWVDEAEVLRYLPEA